MPPSPCATLALWQARANKAAAELTRERARAEREAVLRHRKAAAVKERDNDYLVAEEKVHHLTPRHATPPRPSPE